MRTGTRVPTSRWFTLGLFGLSALTGSSLVGCGRDEKPEQSTFYERRIAPVLVGSCATSQANSSCHVTLDDKGNALGNLSIDSYDTLALRKDLLIDYGPYGMPALLLKAVPPFQVRLTRWDDSEAQIITTDIAHVGGTPLDIGSTSFTQLESWIANGAAENNAPPKARELDLSPCSPTVGSDSAFDPNADPGTPDYDRFVADVNPILKQSCAAGNCHGTTANSLYLTCGDTPEQRRWNYFVAGDYVAVTTENSEILRRTLDPAQGGTFHEGGIIYESPEAADYRKLEGWAAAKGGPSNVPTEAGFGFFAERVQPMLVKRGCMMLNCHSPTIFHDYRLRGGSGGHFGLPANRTNYELTLDQVALESPDPNASRLIRKNLAPGEGGILHRGGPLFASAGDPAACDLEAARTGPLDEQDPYCVIVAWVQMEQAERMADAMPLSGIVYVRKTGSAGNDTPQDWASFSAGAEVVRVEATLGADGAITLGAESSLSALCGLDPATSDARRPAVSWDGQRVAFSARASADEPYRIFVVDGGSCAEEPTINAPAVDDTGTAVPSNGELIHNFDPAFAPDGRIVFTSTRGNVTNVEAFSYQGPQRTPADPSKLNANLYVLEGDTIRQLTFLLNQELTPSFMSDGRVIFTTEKRAPSFYQLAGRRINLDGGDYHPLFGQRSTIGFDQFTDVVELTDKNLVAILSNKSAQRGAGALFVINRSIGVDQRSDDPADYVQDPGAISWPHPNFYQHSMRSLDTRATGQGETQGAYRNPAPLPDGRMLVSYASDATNLEQFNGNFDIAIVNPVTGGRVDLISDSADLLWPVAVYARQDHGVFVSRPDEANAHTRVYTDEGRRDRAQITFMDVPMLVSLLFQNTRTGRVLPEASGVFDLWESLPPEQGVTSFGNGGQFVTSDQYGELYVRRQRLGSPFLFEDGSARALIRGGIPLTFSTTVQLQGDAAPTVHFLREELQFYPGEYARQSFRRELFNGLCGGCHGSVSGRELEVAPNPDILTRASSVAATTADATDLRNPLGSPEAPPFE